MTRGESEGERSPAQGHLRKVTCNGSVKYLCVMQVLLWSRLSLHHYIVWTMELERRHTGVGVTKSNRQWETWDDVCKNFVAPDEDSHHLHVYAASLDAGPDNMGATGRMRIRIDPFRCVMLCIVWCFSHQMQLINAALLVEIFVAPASSTASSTILDHDDMNSFVSPRRRYNTSFSWFCFSVMSICSRILLNTCSFCLVLKTSSSI